MKSRRIRRGWRQGWVLLLLIWLCGPASAVTIEEEDAVGNEAAAVSELSAEDRETMALDSTATQWSFQFAWQVMPD